MEKNKSDNKYKPFTVYDMTYICKFWEVDGMELMAAAFGRSPKSLAELVRRLKRNGQFDQYRRLWDQQYEAEARKAE